MILIIEMAVEKAEKLRYMYMKCAYELTFTYVIIIMITYYINIMISVVNHPELHELSMWFTVLNVYRNRVASITISVF